jgi:TnpA family transposase
MLKLLEFFEIIRVFFLFNYCKRIEKEFREILEKTNVGSGDCEVLIWVRYSGNLF